MTSSVEQVTIAPSNVGLSATMSVQHRSASSSIKSCRDNDAAGVNGRATMDTDTLTLPVIRHAPPGECSSTSIAIASEGQLAKLEHMRRPDTVDTVDSHRLGVSSSTSTTLASTNSGIASDDQDTVQESILKFAVLEDRTRAEHIKDVDTPAEKFHHRFVKRSSSLPPALKPSRYPASQQADQSYFNCLTGSDSIASSDLSPMSGWMPGWVKELVACGNGSDVYSFDCAATHDRRGRLARRGGSRRARSRSCTTPTTTSHWISSRRLHRKAGDKGAVPVVSVFDGNHQGDYRTDNQGEKSYFLCDTPKDKEKSELVASNEILRSNTNGSRVSSVTFAGKDHLRYFTTDLEMGRIDGHDRDNEDGNSSSNFDNERVTRGRRRDDQGSFHSVPGVTIGNSNISLQNHSQDQESFQSSTCQLPPRKDVSSVSPFVFRRCANETVYDSAPLDEAMFSHESTCVNQSRSLSLSGDVSPTNAYFTNTVDVFETAFPDDEIDSDNPLNSSMLSDQPPSLRRATIEHQQSIHHEGAELSMNRAPSPSTSMNGSNGLSCRPYDLPSRRNTTVLHSPTRADLPKSATIMTRNGLTLSVSSKLIQPAVATQSLIAVTTIHTPKEPKSLRARVKQLLPLVRRPMSRHERLAMTGLIVRDKVGTKKIAPIRQASSCEHAMPQVMKSESEYPDLHSSLNFYSSPSMEAFADKSSVDRSTSDSTNPSSDSGISGIHTSTNESHFLHRVRSVISEAQDKATQANSFVDTISLCGPVTGCHESLIDVLSHDKNKTTPLGVEEKDDYLNLTRNGSAHDLVLKENSKSTVDVQHSLQCYESKRSAENAEITLQLHKLGSHQQQRIKEDSRYQRSLPAKKSTQTTTTILTPNSMVKPSSKVHLESLKIAQNSNDHSDVPPALDLSSESLGSLTSLSLISETPEYEPFETDSKQALTKTFQKSSTIASDASCSRCNTHDEEIHDNQKNSTSHTAGVNDRFITCSASDNIPDALEDIAYLYSAFKDLCFSSATDDWFSMQDAEYDEDDDDDESVDETIQSVRKIRS